MQRFYGVDLAAAFFGNPPMPMRRLLALVRQLPPESALGAALQTDSDVGPPRSDDRVVESVAGVNLASLFSGAAA